MARRDFGPSTRRPTQRPRQGNGLLRGLLVGMLMGVIAAAGITWFITREPEVEKPVDDTPPPRSKPAAAKGNKSPSSAKPPAAADKPPTKPPPAPPVTPLPYQYGNILAHDAPLKPDRPAHPQDQWWLQVAALQEEGDARRLRAKLLLLNLDAVVLRAEVGNVLLYRVRVGPFRNQADSIPSLEILSQHHYTPRTLKETVLQ